MGTTVILQGLFHSLPVRHKDFLKNKTREYQRLLRRLQAYALIHTDKRFLCYNQVAKGRHNVLSTVGAQSCLYMRVCVHARVDARTNDFCVSARMREEGAVYCSPSVLDSS